MNSKYKSNNRSRYVDDADIEMELSNSDAEIKLQEIRRRQNRAGVVVNDDMGMSEYFDGDVVDTKTNKVVGKKSIYRNFFDRTIYSGSFMKLLIAVALPTFVVFSLARNSSGGVVTSGGEKLLSMISVNQSKFPIIICVIFAIYIIIVHSFI